MKGLIIFNPVEEDPGFTEGVVVLEDGGIGTLHHNGSYMVTECYQSRLETFDVDVWEYLGNGKMYVNEWPEYQTIHNNLLDNIVKWLTGGSNPIMRLSYECVEPGMEQYRIKQYLKSIKENE